VGWILVGLGGWLVAGFWVAHAFGKAAKDAVPANRDRRDQLGRAGVLSGNPPRMQVFPDFTAVSLTGAIDVQGVYMPAGTRGVVMAGYADGRAYEVEFERPHHLVLTVTAEDLEPAPGPVG
jgi:hypothetical protein